MENVNGKTLKVRMKKENQKLNISEYSLAEIYFRIKIAYFNGIPISLQ